MCFLSVDWSKQGRKISCVCTILVVAELFLAVLALCKLILIACLWVAAHVVKGM